MEKTTLIDAQGKLKEFIKKTRAAITSLEWMSCASAPPPEVWKRCPSAAPSSGKAGKEPVQDVQAAAICQAKYAVEPNQPDMK